MEPGGTGEIRLINSTQIDRKPVISPDVAQIAFFSDREHQNDAEAGNFEIYLKEPIHSFSAELLVDLTAGGFYPSGSPGGNQLVIRLGNDIHRTDADVSLSSVVKLTASSGSDTDPCWSPVEWIGNRLLVIR